MGCKEVNRQDPQSISPALPNGGADRAPLPAHPRPLPRFRAPFPRPRFRAPATNLKSLHGFLTHVLLG